MSAGWWDRAANAGIVGLEPLDQSRVDAHGMVWPHGGYDAGLRVWMEDNYERECSGRSRADWLALADEMLARWAEWRRRVLDAPAEAFTEDETS